MVRRVHPAMRDSADEDDLVTICFDSCYYLVGSEIGVQGEEVNCDVDHLDLVDIEDSTIRQESENSEQRTS